MMRIQVLDLETHLTLCWQPAPDLVRCDRLKGHAGPHSWELRAAAPMPQTVASVGWAQLNVVMVTSQPSQIER